ncbi:organic cation transporter 1-like [Paramacrobiotus metropolitanus]|uniref:organic cation transporter 1-like n=1 Tax=Paramacrobiotus metropolitanus TaxID=2943436 RepID=UPI0024458610|nr:organic cation transporter 1-like [Paramacrobiotus metropolitanus]
MADDPETEVESSVKKKKSKVPKPIFSKFPKRNVKDVGELFDDLIHALGGYGIYQRRITFLIILPLFFFVAFINCIMGFVVSAPSDYFCLIPELTNESLTTSGILLHPAITATDRRLLMPADPALSPPHSGCLQYNINYTRVFLEHNASLASLTAHLNHTSVNLTTTGCQHGWEFQMHQWDQSVVTEWDLVCDWSGAPMVGQVFMVLFFVLGIGVGGFCADKWGRKPVFFTALFVFITFGLSAAFAPTYTAFVILAMLHSLGSGPLYYILYTLGVENLTLRSRVTYVVWLSVVYAFGSMAFILLAYFMRHWRTMTIIGTTPFYLLFIYWFFMPESPRWLLVHERFEQVENYFRNIARVNGVTFDEPAQNKLKKIFTQCEREVNIDHHHMTRWERAAWTRLFTTPPMRRKTLLLVYLLCTLQICYGGLRQLTPSFSGVGADEYFNTFINFLVEIPGYVLTALLCDRLGRRVTLLILFAAAFITCLLTLAFPSKHEYFWGIVAIFLIAKIFFAGAYIVGELLSYETFPTVIRLQGVAFVESIAYLISHISYLIVKLQFHSMVLPIVIFGCMGLVAMLCVFLLPETVSYALPETVEEADMRGAYFRMAPNLRIPEMKKLRFSVSYRKKKDHTEIPETIETARPGTVTLKNFKSSDNANLPVAPIEKVQTVNLNEKVKSPYTHVRNVEDVEVITKPNETGTFVREVDEYRRKDHTEIPETIAATKPGKVTLTNYQRYPPATEPDSLEIPISRAQAVNGNVNSPMHNVRNVDTVEVITKPASEIPGFHNGTGTFVREVDVDVHRHDTNGGSPV